MLPPTEKIPCEPGGAPSSLPSAMKRACASSPSFAGGTLSIAQLTAGTDITRQGVTKHLQILADAGLVHDVKVGRERRWQFEPSQLEEARRSLELIAQQWDFALNKLKLAMES